MKLSQIEPPVCKRRWLFWGALVFALALTLLESARRSERIDAMTALNSELECVQESDSATASGFEGGARFTIASDRSDDLHWIVNTQLATKNGETRLRHVEYDNAPDGRAVHWSSVYAYWIRAVAWVDQTLRGGNVAQSIERAAVYANLLLVGIGIVALAMIVARMWGVASGVGVCLCYLALLAFRDVFKFGMGDHHATAILFSTLCVALLAIALSRSRGSGRTRPYLIFSALFGALGMWVNGVSQMPVLVGLHLGGIAIALMTQEVDRRALAGHWRVWARYGFLFSVLAYLFEYAPNDFGMRLEVNHPLYALTWLGGGELVGAMLERKGWRRLINWRVGLSLVAIFQLPLVLLVARAQIFEVADPFLLALHERYIMEFQSLWANLLALPSPLRSLATLLPFLALGVGAVRLIVDGRRGVVQPGLVLAMGVAIVVSVLTLHQARWWAHSSALLIPLFALGLADHQSKWARGILLASLFPGLLFTATLAFVDEPISRKEKLRAVERGVAHLLRLRSGERDFVALASPDATTNLIYYGGGKGIGTFYWENHEGLKRAAEIFAAPTAEAARDLIDDAGITHVVIYSWGGFEKEYLQLYADFLADGPVPASPFLMQLVRDQQIPNWLRPLAFQPPEGIAEEGDVALLFERVAEMSDGLAAARRFEYLLEMGLNSAALSLSDVLASHAESEPAVAISYARALALSGRREAFRSRVGQLGRDAEAWDDLALEDRIRLSGVLAIAGMRDEARTHIERAISQLDEEALHMLSADAIMHFFDLSRSLQIGLADADLARRARAMLPNRMKARFDAL